MCIKCNKLSGLLTWERDRLDYVNKFNEYVELQNHFESLEAELIFVDDLMGRLPNQEPELNRVWDEIQKELDEIDQQMYTIRLEMEEYNDFK